MRVSARLGQKRPLGLSGLLIAAKVAFAVTYAVAAYAAKGENPTVDAGAARAGATGRPICVHMGTRSEGWAWPNGRFIHWAQCKGVVPRCRKADKQHAPEGWYGHGVLIAPDRCAEHGK